MLKVKVDIPNSANWSVKTLGELCTLISRGTAPVYVVQSSVSAIGQRCVASAGFDAGKVRPHSSTAMNRVLRPVLGDVLLNSTGTGTLGRSCVFDAKGAFMVDGHVTVLRPSINVLDAGWLNAFLRSTWGQRHLERYCYSGSTNQLELNRFPLMRSAIPAPPIEEQRMFSSIICSIDTAMRQTEAIIEKLKLVKQALLHDLLTRGVDANGELRPPQSQAPHLYKDSPLGWIPNEWSCIQLGELADSSVIGPFGSDLVAADYRLSGVPIVFVRDVKVGRFIWKSSVFVSSEKAVALSAHNVRPGDVIATKMGFPPCVAAVYPDSMPDGVITADIVRLRFNGSIVKSLWVSCSVNDDAVLKQVGQITAGVTRPKVTLHDVRNLVVRLPSLDEQNRILERVVGMDQRLDIEQVLLDKLSLKKTGLMDDLLTGRVRVTALLDTP
jgi:type I restriction enzyme S subunit